SDWSSAVCSSDLASTASTLPSSIPSRSTAAAGKRRNAPPPHRRRLLARHAGAGDPSRRTRPARSRHAVGLLVAGEVVAWTPSPRFRHIVPPLAGRVDLSHKD